jgi:mannan endo-1,4-beta-mannosidase
MTNLNYSRMSTIILILITLIGLISITSYYYKYFKHNKEISFQITDTTFSKNFTLLSTEDSIAPSQTIDNTSNSKSPILWGAYVGDNSTSLSNFENIVGKKTNLYADFESWSNTFPLKLLTNVGQSGKTLVIFWEPNFGYDQIINGSEDLYIKQFASDAEKYSYPVIIVPFDEMNLNDQAWGYGQNDNTAEKFISAWKHTHDLFAGVANVKFGLAYNSSSIPNIKGNLFADYYPGDKYVDYVGVDGFSFVSSWKNFGDIFDNAINELDLYNKPIIIFSVAAENYSQKASWITEGLGDHIKNYSNVIGWIWFNKGSKENWLVNSNIDSLNAFKSILP